jgi:hypothetical protein
MSIESAVRAWIKAGSGFDDAHVFLGDQKVPRPTGPYITIKVMSDKSLGAVAEHFWVYDAHRPAGQEMAITTREQLELSLSIQVFNAATVGSSHAVDVMRRIRASIGLPSIRDAINNAGLGLSGISDIKNLSTLLGTAFDGRASMDVSFYTTCDASEYTTFIEKATITDTTLGKVYTIQA